MRFSLAIAALAPVLSVLAEDHLILVGAGGSLTYSPSNITAAQGDTVTFQFQAKNHTVTQSTFASPCTIQTTPAQGIDSGFQNVDNTSSTVPEWSFTVDNATTPLWFFCAQVGHCQKGMVFSVNAKPDGPKSYAVYQAAAMGNAAAVESAAAASASAAGGAAGGAASPTDSAGGAAASGGASASAGGAGAGAGGAANSAGGAAPTDAGLTGAGGASATGADGAIQSGTNSTSPSAGFRVGGSTMGLVAAVSFTVLLL
jgi:plastocyanin